VVRTQDSLQFSIHQDANFTINGGPDITGAIVCKNFYANGNVHWHYDRELDHLGDAVDYRILSYVEILDEAR